MIPGLTSGRTAVDGLSRQRAGSVARRTCLADVLVDVPAASQVHRPVVRKTVALDDLVIDPVVRLYLVDVPAPDLGADRSDLRRLFDALAEQWGLADLDMRPAILATLQPALAGGARTVTVAVHGALGVRGVARASSTPPTAWRSTSARRPSPGICATSRPARSSRRPGS